MANHRHSALLGALITPLSQGRFLLYGLALFALKIGLDLLVASAFHRPYSPLFYVSPIDSPLLQPGKQLGYWFAMWALALPFLVIGPGLVLRRLRDAALPPALALLFFVPFANLLFFAACALVPARPPGPWPGRPSPGSRSFAAAAIMAGFAGAAVGLGAVGVSVGLMRQYGAALMLGAPAIAGFVSAVLFCRLHSPRAAGVAVTGLIAFGLSYAVLIGFAFEGVVCLLMALPLLAFSAAVGAAAGYGVSVAAGSPLQAGSAVVVLPFLFLAERYQPLPEPDAAAVESVIELNAPPEVVFERVIAFPPLPPPTELLFRLGVAAPLRATIDGEGPGAVRRCEFTTGAFVEPITVWRPGRELSFSVSSQPDPLREQTLYPASRPPHLDGYLESVRGQFVLEPLPGGRTRLIGRTWYRTHLAPDPYWRLFTDPVIHAIHLRVLRHIGALAEADQARR